MRWILAAAVTLVPSVALAHISLTYPPPRTTNQKVAVCGVINSQRGSNVTTLPPGSTITVMWKETIDRPGHFRIAFDEDGQDFPIPPTTVPGGTANMPTVMVDP